MVKVLIADDHPAHRKLLAAIFESFGCQVTAVDNVAAAVPIAPAFGLVCLDRHMPGMKGDEAAARIEGGGLLIACTSDPEGAADVFDMVISKPVSCQAVQTAVIAARALARGLQRQERLRRSERRAG